jgi:hypothetical protein
LGAQSPLAGCPLSVKLRLQGPQRTVSGLETILGKEEWSRLLIRLRVVQFQLKLLLALLG